jgi:ATP-dependent Clp protease ATP-binding subunit ClpA
VFERFTQEARHVVVLAQEESRELSHDYIGTEHILLGLAREGTGPASSVLASFGITAEVARKHVSRIVGRGSEPSPGQLPFTPRAKKVLELSLREALALGHDYIAPSTSCSAWLARTRGSRPGSSANSAPIATRFMRRRSSFWQDSRRG